MLALVAVVAVVALPDRAPVNVVVVRLLVDGLKDKPVPKLKAWLELVEEATNNGKNEALVEVDTVAPLLALVAVVAVAALPPILKLATGVVEATENGAVPVANVEVSCPDILIVVAPVMAPVESMTIEGVFRKFLYPVAEAKLIPLVVLSASLPLVPAAKLMTFKVLVPEDGLVLLTGVKTTPPTVVPAPALVVVKE